MLDLSQWLPRCQADALSTSGQIVCRTGFDVIVGVVGSVHGRGFVWSVSVGEVLLRGLLY